MSLRLNLGRMPPQDGKGNWRFPVTPEAMIYANAYEVLITRVFEYRVRNNIDPGDPEAEINRWYCDQWPSFCYEASAMGTANAAGKPAGESMLNKVSRWVSGMIRKMPRGGYALLAPAEADKRAEICIACSKNGGWRGGCNGCSASTLQLLQQLKNLRKTKYDGSLMGCTVASWENGAASWLPADVLPVTPEQRAAMPGLCWRKALP